MEGWVKTHRKFLKWEWFTSPYMYHLFSYLLLKARYEDGDWRGIPLKRGQIITGLKSLSKNTGISVRSLRTCISRLKSTGEIAVKSTNKYSIITICNYDNYQSMDDFNDKQNDKLAGKQPTNNRQASDNKEEREEDKERKKLRIKRENLILKQNKKLRLKEDKKDKEFQEYLKTYGDDDKVVN